MKSLAESLLEEGELKGEVKGELKGEAKIIVGLLKLNNKHNLTSLLSTFHWVGKRSEVMPH